MNENREDDFVEIGGLRVKAGGFLAKILVPSQADIASGILPVPLTTERIHPGEFLRFEFLEPMELSEDDFARHVGVATETIADLCEERARITMDLALRLGAALGTTADFWLNAQHAYDDSQELKRLFDTGGIEALEKIPALNT